MKSETKSTIPVISAEVQANGKSVQPKETVSSVSATSPGSGSSRRCFYVVGEGGSGNETILTYKHMLVKRNVLVANSIRYRGFDNDPKYKEQFDPDEFVDWSGVNLGNFLQVALAHPQQFPALKQLGDLTTLLEELQPVPILIGGCRDNRRIGKALYLRQAELAGNQLILDLVAPANELRWAGKGINGSGNGQATPSADLEALIIVQSFSGGGAKGNTAALADAWVISHQLRDAGFSRFRIDPVIYLPEVFKTTKQERIKANTHAFLLELAAVYTRSLPKMKIGPIWVERTSPYGLIKLVNGVDEQGHDYNQQEVYAIEAECFRLSNFGPTGDFLESLIPNIVDELSWPYVGYSQKCLVKVLPVKELKKLFGLKQMKMHIDHLGHQPNPAETKQQSRKLAQEWLRQQQISPRDIAKLFLSEVNSRTIARDLKPYKKLKLATLQVALAKYRTIKRPAWQEIADKEVDRQAEQAAAELSQFIGELINRPDYSPKGVCFTLDDDPEEGIEGVTYLLTQLEQILKRKLAQTQTELDRQRYKLAKRGFITTRLFFKLFPRLYKHRLMKLTTTLLALELLEIKLRAQLELVKRVEQNVQSHSQAMETWETVLKKGSLVADEQARQYASQRQHRPIFEENILNHAEEEGLFTDRINHAFKLGRQGVSFVWNKDGWVLQCGPDEHPPIFNLDEFNTAAGLERFLNSYVINFWDDLDDLSLEAILEKRGDDPVELISGMKGRCSPLISIDEEQHQVQGGEKAVQLRREHILGIQHGKQGFLQGYPKQNGFEIVATGEAGKHRLELLSTVFYVNPLALTQSSAYQTAYDRLRVAGHKLHIFDEAELGLSDGG